MPCSLALYHNFMIFLFQFNNSHFLIMTEFALLHINIEQYIIYEYKLDWIV